MVEYRTVGLDAVFAALANPTRRALLARLARGRTSITALAGPFAMSLPAVSKHLRVLEGAGLVARDKEGRVHRCRLMARPMREAAEWLARYRRHWEERIDALDANLARTAAAGGEGRRASSGPRERRRKGRPGARRAPRHVRTV
jgi:DNA-binding transcriptional ArsR family regulator